MKEIKKFNGGCPNVVTKKSTNLCLLDGKKVITMASTLFGQHQIKKSQKYIKAKHLRAEIEQPLGVFKYKLEMGGVDYLNQNIRCLYYWSLKQKVVVAYFSVFHQLPRFLFISNSIFGVNVRVA